MPLPVRSPLEVKAIIKLVRTIGGDDGEAELPTAESRFGICPHKHLVRRAKEGNGIYRGKLVVGNHGQVIAGGLEWRPGRLRHRAEE